MSMLIKVAEYLTPVLKESRFKETGVITPNEFVLAGDYLVHHCPTWQWQSGDKTKLKSYLPNNKQFLITRQMPCLKRYKDLELIKFKEQIIDENDDEGGWVDADFNEHQKEEDEIVLGVEVNEQSLVNHNNRSDDPSVKDEEDDYESEAEDIETYMKRQTTEEEPISPTEVLSILEKKTDLSNINEIVGTRTYDLYITYDKYYQTPRLWFSGFDEYLTPLPLEKMYDDISEDHARKTVTMEWHPHIPGMMASVHPCRHAEMMKKIMKTMEGNEKELKVDRYLVVFLKFVQSVIPTIDYDYTQNIVM